MTRGEEGEGEHREVNSRARESAKMEAAQSRWEEEEEEEREVKGALSWPGELKSPQCTDSIKPLTACVWESDRPSGAEEACWFAKGWGLVCGLRSSVVHAYLARELP